MASEVYEFSSLTEAATRVASDTMFKVLESKKYSAGKAVDEWIDLSLLLAWKK